MSKGLGNFFLDPFPLAPAVAVASGSRNLPEPKPLARGSRKKNSAFFLDPAGVANPRPTQRSLHRWGWAPSRVWACDLRALFPPKPPLRRLQRPAAHAMRRPDHKISANMPGEIHTKPRKFGWQRLGHRARRTTYSVKPCNTPAAGESASPASMSRACRASCSAVRRASSRA